MMTRREGSVDHIRKAHNLVAKAEECWNAGSIAAVEACLARLEESAAELSAAQATDMGPADLLPGLREELLQMKARVTRIENLSDLAAALLRRGSPSAGDSPMYRAGGFEDSDHSLSTSLAPTTRMQA